MKKFLLDTKWCPVLLFYEEAEIDTINENNTNYTNNVKVINQYTNKKNAFSLVDGAADRRQNYDYINLENKNATISEGICC